MFGRHLVVTFAIIVVPVMFPWAGEVAIENLLLVRRQDAANVGHSLPEQLMPPMHKILTRLHHLEAGIAQDIGDSIALGRSQIELTIHSVDQAAAWHAQVAVPIAHRAQREANQDAGDSDQ